MKQVLLNQTDREKLYTHCHHNTRTILNLVNNVKLYIICTTFTIRNTIFSKRDTIFNIRDTIFNIRNTILDQVYLAKFYDQMLIKLKQSTTISSFTLYHKTILLLGTSRTDQRYLPSVPGTCGVVVQTKVFIFINYEIFCNKNEKQKILHCQNIFKIQ